MTLGMSRRALLQAAATALPFGLRVDRAAVQPAADGRGRVRDTFPATPPELVRDMVWVAHFDEKRVRALVEARPALARAAWDWGFGDFETALGAASHMGSRGIAEYLIGKGARPTLFSAAMLGQIDVVRAVLAASPGAHRIRGPHGISLLAHARMGGAFARAVVDLLQTMDGADDEATVPLSAEAAARLVGTYVFGLSPSEQVEIDANMNSYAGSKAYSHPPQLNWTRAGAVPRPLFHVGDNAFHPAGAPAVRIRFAESGRDTIMTVSDPDPVLTATRRTP